MKIKLSVMSGKLDGVGAINTNTLSNPHCITMHANKRTICGNCYSFKMLRSYRSNCVDVWERNSQLLSNSLIPVEDLPIINAHSFRFHGHGELINKTHYLNFLRIARKNPASTFALWTKRKDIIRAAAKSIDPAAIRPDNLILILSNPIKDRVLKTPPKYFDKVFNNITKPSTADNCTGRKCIDCRQCYSLNSGVDSIIEMEK